MPKLNADKLIRLSYPGRRKPGSVGRCLVEGPELRDDQLFLDFVHPNDNLRARLWRARFVWGGHDVGQVWPTSQMRQSVKAYTASQNRQIKKLCYCGAIR
jgi:hypothetical protein